MKILFTIFLILAQLRTVDASSGDAAGVRGTRRSATAPAVIMGSAAQARGVVVINEIHYHPIEPGASFVEIHNTSPTLSFDLSGWDLRGTGFLFPSNTILSPGGFLVVVANRIEFARINGLSLLPVGEFTGSLENGGETLKLVKPGAVATDDLLIDEVRYDDDPPWVSEPDGGGPSLQLIDPSQDHNRPGNWGSTATNATVRFTPGAPNTVRGTLAPFPNVWLNEVAPENVGGVLDSFGDADPWVELFNPGPSAVDLTGLYLSSTTSNPFQWPFPSGTSIGPGGFLLVWLDGEPLESSPTELHANFRPPIGQGTVILSRQQDGGAGGIDGLNYSGVTPGRSFGSYPEGQPVDRRVFHFPSPRAVNNPRSVTTAVVINEWMASNTSTLADSADGQFEDWIELYNQSGVPVDLSGYFLTDTPTNKVKFLIPNGWTIPANGFLLVWADEEGLQNAAKVDLHANFKLATAGEYIGLYAPDGTLLDGIEFGPQANDVSQARFPDGALTGLRTTRMATPKRANVVPPMITTEPADTIADSDTRVTLSVRASGSEPMSYQWRKGTINVPEGTGPDLVLSSVTVAQGGAYSVVISNAAGSATSREMSLTVRPPAIPTVRFEVLGGQGGQGSEVVVPVLTRSFNLMATLQFSLQWDPAILTFKAIEQLGLEGLSLSSFATDRVGSGSLVLSWDDLSGLGRSLPDGSVVFALRFTLSGAAGSSSTVRVVSTPVAIEAAALIGGQPTAIQTGMTDGQVQILSTVRIGGTVRYYTLDRGVPGAAVGVYSDVGVRLEGADTLDDGTFSFLASPGGTRSVRVTPPTGGPASQGISTLDITLVRRHILGISALDSPYKILAADVNGSGSVSTLDITLMRRVILGIADAFPAGAWRFVPASYAFPDPTSPWAPESERVIPVLDSDRLGTDFIGIRTGDVNGSWTSPTVP